MVSVDPLVEMRMIDAEVIDGINTQFVYGDFTIFSEPPQHFSRWNPVPTIVLHGELVTRQYYATEKPSFGKPWLSPLPTTAPTVVLLGELLKRQNTVEPSFEKPSFSPFPAPALAPSAIPTSTWTGAETTTSIQTVPTNAVTAIVGIFRDPAFGVTLTTTSFSAYSGFITRSIILIPTITTTSTNFRVIPPPTPDPTPSRGGKNWKAISIPIIIVFVFVCIFCIWLCWHQTKQRAQLDEARRARREDEELRAAAAARNIVGTGLPHLTRQNDQQDGAGGTTAIALRARRGWDGVRQSVFGFGFPSQRKTERRDQQQQVEEMEMGRMRTSPPAYDAGDYSRSVEMGLGREGSNAGGSRPSHLQEVEMRRAVEGFNYLEERRQQRQQKAERLTPPEERWYGTPGYDPDVGFKRRSSEPLSNHGPNQRALPKQAVELMRRRGITLAGGERPKALYAASQGSREVNGEGDDDVYPRAPPNTPVSPVRWQAAPRAPFNPPTSPTHRQARLRAPIPSSLYSQTTDGRRLPYHLRPWAHVPPYVDTSNPYTEVFEEDVEDADYSALETDVSITPKPEAFFVPGGRPTTPDIQFVMGVKPEGYRFPKMEKLGLRMEEADEK